MISFHVGGSTKRTEAFLKAVANLKIDGVLDACGQEGVQALSMATPYSTGLAANSWTYKIESKGGIYTISWYNGDVENGFPVAIMLQYGYSTGTGGYVQGQDYINPAIKPIFDKISERVWKAVTSA